MTKEIVGQACLLSFLSRRGFSVALEHVHFFKVVQHTCTGVYSHAMHAYRLRDYTAHAHKGPRVARQFA